LLDVAGYFDPLIAMFDRAVQDGFIRAEHRELVRVERDVATMLDRLISHRPLAVEPWADAPEA
jgi:predicted Rossmann-fold nucleotide-binding protein